MISELYENVQVDFGANELIVKMLSTEEESVDSKVPYSLFES